MRVLVIPPAAQRDDNAIQMISAWIAEKGLHCTMNVGMWDEAGRDEPLSWGVLLADVVRHVANALQESKGWPAPETSEKIFAALQTELERPTSPASGTFHPGHD